MRYWSMFVVIMFVFVFAFTVAAIATAAPLTPRPVDQLAAETLSRAIRQSATVRDLVAVLESSNVLVHIETSGNMPAGISGMTRFVTSRGGYRYLRITLSSTLPGDARTAILGHELRHACEVAASSAGDAGTIRHLFESEGYRQGAYFDTRAALITEKNIRKELSAAAAAERSLQAEPVAKFHH